MSEIEVVKHNKINGMTAFFNNVVYRSAHLHSDWELVWIIENSMGIDCEGTSFVAREGDLVLFSPFQVHEFMKIDNSCTFMCLQVSPVFLGISNTMVSKSVHPADFLTQEELERVRTQLYKMMKKYVMEDNLYQAYCTGRCSLLMYSILSKMPMSVLSTEESDSRNKRSERLVRMINYVDRNYTHKVRLCDFAESEGVSLCYMSHFIQTSLGQSFQNYLNTVRFNHACALISNGGMKLYDIFNASGFSDYKYFVKTFVEKSGLTPEDYSKSFARTGPDIRNSGYESDPGTEEIIFNRAQEIALLEKIKKQGWKNAD